MPDMPANTDSSSSSRPVPAEGESTPCVDRCGYCPQCLAVSLSPRQMAKEMETRINALMEWANALCDRLDEADARLVVLQQERDALFCQKHQTPTTACLTCVAAPLQSQIMALQQERDAMMADIEAAAGELLVPLPEPGSITSRLLIANRLLRQRAETAEQALREAREQQ